MKKYTSLTNVYDIPHQKNQTNIYKEKKIVYPKKLIKHQTEIFEQVNLKPILSRSPSSISVVSSKQPTTTSSSQVLQYVTPPN